MVLVSRQTVITDAGWLPWLIESLKVEGIDVPLEDSTDSRMEVGVCVGSARNCRLVVGTTGRGPASLAVPQLRCGRRAGYALDVLEGLHHVVEVLGSGVADFLSLPEAERVDEEKLDTTFDQRVGCTVGEFVPAVGSADLDGWEHLLDAVDLVEQLLTGKVATVQGLGADGDGVDCVLIARNVLFQGTGVGVEGGLHVGPELGVSWSADIIETNETYHTPRRTLKPLAFAAGRMY